MKENNVASESSLDRALEQQEDKLIGAFSIMEFCHAHGGITRQHFHSIVKRGMGPHTFKVGKRTLISREAARAWVYRMEKESYDTNSEKN